MGISCGHNLQKNRLIAAYVATTYRAQLPVGEVSLRVGDCSPVLDDWLRVGEYENWAYLTAANPRSQRLPDAENKALMQALAQALKELAVAAERPAKSPLQWFSGAASSDAADWPDEPSFLVVGLAREVAISLAARFEQNALLVGCTDGVAELVWVPVSASAR